MEEKLNLRELGAVESKGELAALTEEIRRFVRERDWEQFHTPKNLVMALTGEVGELAEIFQWLTPEQALQVMDHPQKTEQVRRELADVCTYVLRLADILKVDLAQAIRSKMQENAAKYPVELAKGRSEKYTELPGRAKRQKKLKFTSLWVDMGNVLVFFSMDRMHRQLAQILGIGVQRAAEILLQDRLQWNFEKGLISRQDFIASLLSRANYQGKSENLGLNHQTISQALERAFCDIFAINQPMVDWVLDAKSQGVQLVLVSNTNELHVEFILQKYNFLSAFDHQVLSYEVKAMKPEKEYFTQALARSQTLPQDILYIDDIQENIIGGKEFGVHTHHFIDFEGLQALHP